LLKIAVLISGGGSNLQSIIDAVNEENLNCSIQCVISDKPGVYGLERASTNGIETHVVDKKVYGTRLSDVILEHIKGKVDLIVLAGFLSILRGEILEEYKDKIINIHPSLIPSFCGNGMYGIKVHENVVKSGVKVSGCTVHFVDAGTDSGPIILQRTVPVFYQDDAATLQKRVLVEEHKALPMAIKLFSEHRVKIIENRVDIVNEGGIFID
jgi:phosphoribosylglycinamide formyltransferase-1